MMYYDCVQLLKVTPIRRRFKIHTLPFFKVKSTNYLLIRKVQLVQQIDQGHWVKALYRCRWAIWYRRQCFLDNKSYDLRIWLITLHINDGLNNRWLYIILYQNGVHSYFQYFLLLLHIEICVMPYIRVEWLQIILMMCIFPRNVFLILMLIQFHE